MDLRVPIEYSGNEYTVGGLHYLFNVGTVGSSVFMFIFSNDHRLQGSSPDDGYRYGYQYSWISRNVGGSVGVFNINEDSLCILLRAVIGVGAVDTTVQQQNNIKMKEQYLLSGVIGDEISSGRKEYHSYSLNNYMKQGGKEKYPYWVGIELEVEANNTPCFDYIKNIRSNWFHVERDGSLSSTGCEFVTIKMNPKVAVAEKTWEDLCENLVKLGATSHDSGRCGLHVHISRTAFGQTDDERDETIGKLMHMYHNELGASGFGTDYVKQVMRRGYVDYAKNVTAGMKLETRTMLTFTQAAGLNAVSNEHSKKSFKDLSKSSTQDGRYTAINRVPTHTIEFRQGKGTLKASSIVATIQFCCELVEFSRDTPKKLCTRESFMNRIKRLPKHNPLKNILTPLRDI